MSRAAARQILDTLYILPTTHQGATLVYDTVHVFIGIHAVTVSKAGVGSWTFELDRKTRQLLPLDLHELVQLVRELRYNLWGLYEKKKIENEQPVEETGWIWIPSSSSSSSVRDYSSLVSD